MAIGEDQGNHPATGTQIKDLIKAAGGYKMSQQNGINGKAVTSPGLGAEELAVKETVVAEI